MSVAERMTQPLADKLVADDKSQGSRENSFKSSGRWSFRIGTTPIQNYLTGRALSYEQYKVMLWIVFVYTFVVVCLEVWFNAYCWRRETNTAIVTMFAPIGFFLNSLLVLRLIFQPKTFWALLSSALAILLTIVNVVVIAVKYADGSMTGNVMLGLHIMFCIVQIYVANLLYRYWEFVKYNYDENLEMTLRELAENRYSLQSNSVLSSLHAPSPSPKSGNRKSKHVVISLTDMVGGSEGRPPSDRYPAFSPGPSACGSDKV